MTLAAVVSPYLPINGLTGLGLNDGALFIGVDGMDPQTNPQACYWDAAGTIPAAQPIQILGGYPMRLGTPTRLYTASTYSIRVRDASGAQVFYEAHAVPASNVNFGFFPSVAAAQAASIPASIQAVGLLLTGYYAEGDGGGGTYRYAAVQAAGPGRFQSADGAWWELSGETFSARQFGAKADGSDAFAAINTMLSLSTPGALLNGPFSSGQQLSVPAGYSLHARGASLLGSGGSAMNFTGADASVDGLTIGGPAANQIISASNNAARGKIRNAILTSQGAAHGIHLNSVGLNDWTISGVAINAQGYGLLVNTTAGGSSGLIVSDVRISSATADAIEYNTPAAALFNVLTWGAQLAATGGASAAAGFGLGIAHNQGFVAGGLVISQSRQEAIHIEDGCRSGVIVGVAARNAGRDGIRHLRGGAGANEAQARPLVYSALSIEGVSPAPAGSVGFFQVWAPEGVQTRNPIVAGFFGSFAYGAWLNGPGLHAATYLSFEDVATVLRVSNSRSLTSVPGEFFSKGATAFVQVDSGAAFDLGTFHEEGFLPNPMVTYVAARAMPATKLRGFSGQSPTFVSSGAVGDAWVPLFAAPVRIKGALTLYLLWRGQTLGEFWEGDVLYTGFLADGVTPSNDFLPTTNAVKQGNADFDVNVGNLLRINAGMVEIKIFFSAAAVRTVDIFASFHGCYYA